MRPPSGYARFWLSPLVFVAKKSDLHGAVEYESHSRWWRRSRSKTEDRSLARETLPGAFFTEGTAPGEVSTRNSLALADVFAAVRVLAQGAAMCPLRVYGETADGAVEVTGGATEALLEKPAPGVTKPMLVMQLVAHLALWGECFIGKYRAPDGSVEQLAALAPDAVTVELVAGQPRFKYTAPDGEIDENLTLDDIIHVKGLTLSGIRGISPIRQCRESVAMAKAVTESGATTWHNGGRPAGLFTVPNGNEAEEQAKNLAKAFEARHGGPANAGRVAVVTGDIGWSPVSMSLQDAEWVATRNLSTAEVARIMGVQPFTINAQTSDSLTYATVAMQAEAHVRWDLAPRLLLLETAISNDDDLCPGPLSVKADLDALLRTDTKTRYETYAVGLSNGFLTHDDIRRQEDLPPLTTGGETENAPDG